MSNTVPKTAEKIRYVEGVGRRKTAIARVRIVSGRGQGIINEKNFDAYFPLQRLQKKVFAPLTALKMEAKINFTAKVVGGGITAQAEAVRHGLSRALTLMNPTYKKRLRTEGFLTRDPRMVERKKYGLKKARRAPQWAKR